MATSLEDFIASTLEQIVAGVRRSQEPARQHGARINPAHAAHGHSQAVEFDVAVTVSETEKVKSGIGVVVMGLLGAGVQGASESTNAAINRIRFKVFLDLPPDPPGGQPPVPRPAE